MVFDAIDDIKRLYNVDTDRVLLTGFSDGASGSYYLSMTSPTTFCQFWPFNGFAAVATMTGGKVFLESMKNRPMFACNTTEDSLYPPNYYNPFVKAMKEARVPLTFHEFENIGHNFAYIDKIAEETRQHFAKTKRDPWANELTWVSAESGKFSRMDWIEILETGAAENSCEFENRTVSISSGVKLGINIDQNFTGKGVRVASVEAGSNAANIGMQAGDVILEMQGSKIFPVSTTSGRYSLNSKAAEKLSSLQ
ncbi:MAG: PDZ domain-containing protein [Planctomycetota bacterium]|nr:PDZ domain-containing protein [Planctomycetota bacterium]